MNKIGWCSQTWNPVWGCRNICPYCYARTIAKRFGGIRFTEEWKYRTEHNMETNHFKLQNSLDLIEFRPTFLHSQFNKKFPKKPQRIFVGSMSEIEFWREDWMKKVIEKTKEYPQHVFQFLTKHPEVYNRYVFPANCWLGVTVTNRMDLYCMRRKVLMKTHNIYYLSIEPLMDDVFPEFKECEGWFDWVIIGAETGNRRGKVIPNLDWVLDIAGYCKHQKIPVFIKDKLIKYYDECRGYKQFPKLKK